MPRTKLSDDVVAARMVELRNLRTAHVRDRKRIVSLKAENKQLRSDLTKLKTLFLETTERQQARIEELEAMVFGRKPVSSTGAKTTHTPAVRAAASYRRPIPPAAAVTAEAHHGITHCHRCGHVLTDKREAIRYEEDIVLAALAPDTPHKTVTRHTVEQGWCSRCGQYSSAQDLRGQVVTIGPVVRSLITYLVVQADQTYAQVVDLLWQLYRFQVNSGEIAHILAARREQYLPAYEQLKEHVRAGPSHLDETSWPIQSEQGSGYAHVMAGVDGMPSAHDVVFVLADSRGKGNSKKLVGAGYDQVGITDRYASYQDLFVLHQICWAHLHRNARDITRLECLSEDKLHHVTAFYQGLARVYTDIRKYRAEPFDKARRQTQAGALLVRTTQLCIPHELDPKKLTDLKAGILKYQDCLFVCLTVDGIPADNNKAERALRKLVIKRKKSFGVKTKKGAQTLEVLLSVCQSLYNRDRDNFLVNLHGLATVSQ